MPSSVTPLTRKLRPTKFGSRYPRFGRSATFLPAAEVDANAIRFTPSPPGYALFLAPPPKAKWARTLELNAMEQIKVFNQPLIYRALKLLHGDPDIASAWRADDHSAAHAVDWSYTLSIDAHALCEVRSKHFSRVHLDFWTPRLRTAEQKEHLAKVAVAFCAALNEFLEQNVHIWDEATDLPTTNDSTTLSNIASEKYESADRLLSAATLLDQRPKAKPVPAGESLGVQAVGYLYAAAAMQFFIALEALVNLLYTLLLRPEFRGRTYERLTVRSEIDLRLISMHVFCSGFSKQPISAGSDLWQRIIDLRDFRNDMVHANITEEHRLHTFTEDDFLFFYSASTDFRGRKLEAKAASALPRAQTQITKRTVRSVKTTVDEVRAAILAAMDQETGQWVNSWISTPLVLPRIPNDP
jgi:hypothetical protein